ncbi:hypothetical protein QBC39DRAFT_374249 [Podospora conica]|nr:hypothetical protein QBC39DRAFT_374249 [Schizothecium conicum]
MAVYCIDRLEEYDGAPSGPATISDPFSLLPKPKIVVAAGIISAVIAAAAAASGSQTD